MINFFIQGGIFMWPLFFIAIIILYLVIRKTIELFIIKNPGIHNLKNGINAILFWGSFSVIFGIFAHFVGVYLAMQAIMAANDISPAIVANGYALSLTTILSGLFLFMASSIIWLILNWRYKKLITKVQ